MKPAPASVIDLQHTRSSVSRSWEDDRPSFPRHAKCWHSADWTRLDERHNTLLCEAYLIWLERRAKCEGEFNLLKHRAAKS
jgi:hypothetical protein